MDKGKARRWMKANLHFYIGDCAEVNMTGLAEGCCQAFDTNHVGGPLDDETHWVWDIAAQVAESWETKNK